VSIELRVPEESDRPQVLECLRVSLNFPARFLERRGPFVPLERFMCAFDGPSLVATAAERPFLQWFGGRQIEMSGVYAVATLPEYRGRGIATDIVGGLMRAARDRGVPLTGLYPAALRPYRRLGYELAGSFTEYRVPLDELPDTSGELPSVEEYRPDDDLEAVRACHREAMKDHTGPFEPGDDTWWTQRIFSARDATEVARAVVVRGDAGEIEGYASFRYEDTEGSLDVSFGIECSAFVATTDRALRALLAYFRGFRGVGRWLQWTGPIGGDPITLLLDEQSVQTAYRYGWMLRLLDVGEALTQRGYPRVSARAVVAVEDPMFPENSGAWTLDVREGVATVERGGEPRSKPLPIGALSSMFTGYLSAANAVRLGHLDRADPSVEALGELLAGPAPWMPDFF
jgi:predicted acetyltransferase